MDRDSLVANSPCPSSVGTRNDLRIIPTTHKIDERKVLDEEEYLDRMSRIIRRDFFLDVEFPSNEDPNTSYRSNTTSKLPNITPGTERSEVSTTSTVRSRNEACSLGLNEFLNKYTSEDNDYFDKMQQNELKRHKAKYPWLFKDTKKHNKLVRNQLKLPSSEGSDLKQIDGPSSSQTKMIDWPYNPTNSLFYAPKDPEAGRSNKTIINYKALRGFREPVFKEPLPPRCDSIPQKRTFSWAIDKIGIDGKLIGSGNETPTINGYSFIPAPETSLRVSAEVKQEQRVLKSDTDRFHIPNDSRHEQLAHRMYQEKVAKNIRTPKTGSKPEIRTPGSLMRTPSSNRKSYAEFSFSPERVKTPRKK